jgi:multidrug efflux pump subunit AcrA (membrane-fusion protein)
MNVVSTFSTSKILYIAIYQILWYHNTHKSMQINKYKALIINNFNIIITKFNKATNKQKAYLALTVLGILGLIAFVIMQSGDVEKIAENTNLRQVELINLGDSDTLGSNLNLSGIIESQSEATVRTESSGRLVRVFKSLGDRVRAGETIAVFENSLDRAAVTQAEGAYEQAKAGRELNKVNLNNSNSGNNLDTAKENALNTINSGYVTMDDVVIGKTDAGFTQPRNISPRLLVLAPNQALTFSIESKRVEIEKLLTKRKITNSTININSDLVAEMDKLVLDLNMVKDYLENLSQIYSIAIDTSSFPQSAIDSQKAIVNGSRSAINQNISAINGAKQALLSANTGNTVTDQAKDPSLAQSDASVKIALGSYQAALARLSKTVISSPINGTLNSLSIKTGDFAGQGQVAAIVSNNNALVVKAFTSSEEVKNIYTGQKVLLNNKLEARVSRVASGIDPNTNKHEIEIIFEDKDKQFTNGQSIRVSVVRDVKEAVKVIKSSAPVKTYVPISSVRITPTGNYIYTVNDGNVLQEIKVELGEINGEEVEVLSGMKNIVKFIKDARGLKNNQKVEIKNK